MKPFTTLAAAAAITVSFATSAAATCTINGDGHITGLFRSRSFNALEDNVTNYIRRNPTGIGVIISQTRGTIIHRGRQDTTGLSDAQADRLCRVGRAQNADLVQTLAPR
jgi:hypothetical protein